MAQPIQKPRSLTGLDHVVRSGATERFTVTLVLMPVPTPVGDGLVAADHEDHSADSQVLLSLRKSRIAEPTADACSRRGDGGAS